MSMAEVGAFILKGYNAEAGIYFRLGRIFSSIHLLLDVLEPITAERLDSSLSQRYLLESSYLNFHKQRFFLPGFFTFLH